MCIRDSYIADGAAGGQVLELGLKFQRRKGINRLGDMDMVAIGDIALVGDDLNDAEALLQAPVSYTHLNNLPAVLEVMKFIYDHIIYAELNTKSDYCQVCGWDGEIEVVEHSFAGSLLS